MPSRLALRLAPKSFTTHYRSYLSTSFLVYSSFIDQILNRESSSSSRWKTRQSKDLFTREAKVQKLKSRAAFKLLEIDSKYDIFKKGQTVVDLGYAPGSWSQVAVERTKPNGRVLGIDIIPAQPPRGASAIQGDFLSPGIQAEAIKFLSKPDHGRPKSDLIFDETESEIKIFPLPSEQDQSYCNFDEKTSGDGESRKSRKQRVIDVVLSDMSAPWDQTSGFWKRTLSDPYLRMMNTSGINLRDHTGSMELCSTALGFALNYLRIGGHFVCKFYQGDEDKELEKILKQSFARVSREKPDSSRKESREAYFVGIRLKSPEN